MNPHSRDILFALRTLLRIALSCGLPSGALQQSLRAALFHTEVALKETRGQHLPT